MSEIARVGGFTAWLTITPRDGDRIRVWFGNPRTSATRVDTLEYDESIVRSGVTTWAEAFRAAGVTTRYLSTRATDVIAFAILPALVVIAAFIVTTVQRIATGG